MTNITRKGFLAAFATASTMILTGCGGNEADSGSGTQSSSGQKDSPASTEPKELEIVESGWSISDQGYVMYGIGIKNPNADKEADLPSFTITGKKQDGSIVFNDQQTLFVIAPNETVYYGFQAGNGTAPDTVEFAIDDCSFSDCGTPDSETFTITNTSEVPGDFGMSSYTGEATLNLDLSGSSSPELLEQTAVTVILRDAEGQIVYGMSTFVNTPDQGESVPFEVSAHSVPEHASYELYAQLW